MTRSVILIGCGKAKLDRLAPARELYTGSLFRAALRYAEARKPDALFIVSARNGITPLDLVLAPYDFTMSDLSKRERSDWGGRIANHLRILYPAGPVTLTILAGKEYVDPIEYGLRWFAGVRQTRWTIDTPLAGLQLGQRLAFLTANTPKET